MIQVPGAEFGKPPAPLAGGSFRAIAGISTKRQDSCVSLSDLRVAVALLVFAQPSVASDSAVPNEICRQLPDGYVVMTSRALSVGPHKFVVVALRSPKEQYSSSYLVSDDRAPDRPLLIYERTGRGGYDLAGRNDHVVLRADEGGYNGCDPFDGQGITAKGSYFTVENAVACGAHWTDYVTFRFDPRAGGFVFDNWRFESWRLNPDNDRNADALVSDGQEVVRAKGRLVPFANWMRPSG